MLSLVITLCPAACWNFVATCLLFDFKVSGVILRVPPG